VTQPRRGGGRRKPSALEYKLVRMEEQRLSHAARREAELTNLPMINEHLQTFKYRRAHWHERVESLNGHA
jgi:hypothetical protein